MKKTLFTLAAASLLILSGAVNVNKKTNVFMGENNIPPKIQLAAGDTHSQSIVKVTTSELSGWGNGGTIALALDVPADKGFGICASILDVENKPVLYDIYGNEVALSSIELHGNGVIINRAKGANYYGYILKVPAGFKFKAGAPFASTSDFKDEIFTCTTEDEYYLCKLNDGVKSGDWTKISKPSSIDVTSTTIELEKGATTDIIPTINGGSEGLIISYKSADETIAKVDQNGRVSAIGNGETTITICAGLTKTIITVKVSDKELVQTGIKIVEGKNLTVIKGENYDLSKVKVVKLYEGNIEGEEISIDSSMVSGEFNKDEVGSYTLTITIGTFTDTFTVSVEEITAVSLKGTTENADFGNNSGWGSQFYFVTTLKDIGQYLNLKDAAFDNAKSNILLNNKEVLKAAKNLGGSRYELYFNDDVVLKTGDVLTLKSELKIYQYTGTVNGSHDPQNDGEFKAVGILDKEYKFVYDGSLWHVYNAEPSELTVETTDMMISVGQEEQIKYSVGPEGTYGIPTFEAANPDLVDISFDGKVTGKAVGKTTIKVKLGTIEKSINVVVEPEKEIKTVKFSNIPNYFSILKDSDPENFKPNLTKAKLVYVDDTTSSEFSIDDTMYNIGSFSTAEEGDIQIPVTITYREKDYETNLSANIYSYYDQKPSEVAIVDWFEYGVFIQLPNTCTNNVNLTNESELEVYQKQIHYNRADGTPVNLQCVYELATNVCIFPEFLYDDEGNIAINESNYNKEGFYEKGDMITIDAMTPIYKWTGEKGANDSPVAGTGEVIIEGYINEKLQYKYNGQIWTTWIEYEDIKLETSEMTLEYGKTATVPVSRVPDIATQGIFSYKSSNDKVVTVTSNGVMKAVGVGTANIEITLSDEDYPEKTKKATLKVTVNDAISGFKLAEEEPLEIKRGTTNEELLAGLNAKFMYASGKEGDVVDFTGAVVSGYDSETLGEQNITITVTKDGTKYTEAIAINVVEAGLPGWAIGLIVVGAVVVVGLVGLAVWLIMKKKSK